MSGMCVYAWNSTRRRIRACSGRESGLKKLLMKINGDAACHLLLPMQARFHHTAENPFFSALIYCFVIYELSTSLLSKLIYILTKNSQVTVKNCFIVFKIY